MFEEDLVTDGLSQEDRHILLSVAVKKTKLFTVSTDARRDLLVPPGHKVRVPGKGGPGSSSLPAAETYVLLAAFHPILDHRVARHPCAFSPNQYMYMYI